MPMTLLELYVGVVGVLMLVASVEQTFLTRFIARASIWGHAPGWQREIAFWNVAMVTVIGGVLWTRDATAARIATAAIVVLTVFLGTNHLLAFRSQRQGWVHRVGAIVNYAGAVTGTAALLLA